VCGVDDCGVVVVVGDGIAVVFRVVGVAVVRVHVSPDVTVDGVDNVTFIVDGAADVGAVVVVDK